MINKSLVPAYTEATSAMQQEIVQDVIGQVGQIKKEIAAWQNESLKGTHVSGCSLRQTKTAD